MAPEVALVVDKMRKEGSLRIVAARVVAIQTHANSVHVEIRRRGQAHIEVLPAKRAFNCTGPNLDFRQPEPSFIASLIANGSAVADKSGLGISTLDCGVVVNKLGEPSSTIVTIGSLRRGALWETTAVPELRGQAVELAQTIVNSVTIDNYCPAQQALQL